MAQDAQRELFQWQWPPADQYPLNNVVGNAGQWVRKDLKESENYLILTGFSSLEYLIEELGSEKIWKKRSIQVVLGNEPILREELITEKLTQSKHNLSDHIREYWLNKQISIKLNGPLLSFIKAIEDGNINFRIYPNLHGKVYIGDKHLVTGSSNFSYSGMEKQAEINVRYEHGTTEYEDLKGIAEHYVSKSNDYTNDLLDLLHSLLQLVTWEEALARAVAELLEGDWVEEYFKNVHPGQELNLWPTQRQAIGQALYILDNEGSVLIAEPTGSGKTRVGAHLLAALLNRFWQQGRGNRSNYKIITPPLVTVNWQEELDDLYFTVAGPISQGKLSNKPSTRQSLLKDIREATVLLIDEAHNYLNKNSNRTKSISRNNADHVVLFTATPINRNWSDLLRMIELLGLDNLSDTAYKSYQKLKRIQRRSGSNPDSSVLQKLRDYSQKFIVRRTKREINEIIDRRPEAFKDQDGKRCRFPKHICKTYTVNEAEKDVALGCKIDALADDLKGIIFLRTIQMTKKQEEEGIDPENLVFGRMKAAAALSKYNIKNCLRSSRAALVEHLSGTEQAVEWANLDSLSKANSGNIISKLKGIDNLPNIKNINDKHLPDWLKDEDKYLNTVQEEINLLEQISTAVRDMSDSRERSKANFLLDLLSEHHHILAFDSIVITQSVLNKLLKEKLPNGIRLVIATGSRNNSGKEKIQELLHPSSNSSDVIGLCTDALSEGVNLQKSSTVVFLDMPTVIRKAEQRAGRIDRLNSPYEEIDIFWPKDHKVFQLEADKKFIQRHDLVDTIIESNIKIPENFAADRKEKIDPEIMGRLYEKRQDEDREWAGVDDAFKPVRKFIEDDGLIEKELYEDYKEVTTKVLSRVSLVKSNQPWGFFAIRGSDQRAPKWVLIRDDKELSRDLPEICSFLDSTLPDCVNIEENLKTADKYVGRMVDRLNRSQIELLPNKRKRALNIFEQLINKWLKDTEGSGCREIYKKFQKLFGNHFKIQGHSVDCYEFSQLLLDIYHPYYAKAEEDRNKGARHFNSLRDLKRWLKDNPIDKEDLEYLWNNIPYEKPLEKQVAAAIIAIPKDEI